MRKRFRQFVDRLPRVHGPRGAALLGFACITLSFTSQYLGPLANNERANGPLGWEVWGWLWASCTIILALAAFHVDQSKALGLFAGLIFLVGCAYIVENRPLSTVLFWGFSWACICIGQLINPASEHVEEVTKPGPPNRGGDGGGS